MARQKGDKSWSQKEIEIVEDNAGFMPLHEIVNELSKNGFSRTGEAVRGYCKKHDISLVRNYDSLSISKVANLLGISRGAVSYWHESGQLPVKRINRCHLIVRFNDVKKLLQSREFRVKFNEDGLNFFLSK